MNALLVYPFFPDSYWSFRHALSLENRRSAFPPLGLMTISAMMPRSWRRRLIDMNVQPLRARDIEWADMVFVSAMRIQGESMTRVIRQCKRMGKRVVVGGPYVSSTPEEASEADHVFIGEAEATFPEFVRDVTAAGLCLGGPHVGAVRRVYEAAERPDLTTSPIPEFELATLNQYLAVPLQYSRGCPFRCEFCDIIELYGRVPRTKTNEQVLAELDALYHTGRRGAVFIVDDNFIGNKRSVRTLLPPLAEWSKR
ncbi:MAG TPA: cobalamin-dependent protein, partial [Gemmataceae bacterium]|nr:cobalamin-dependent protein [Gemmataceae bacterium]